VKRERDLHGRKGEVRILRGAEGKPDRERPKKRIFEGLGHYQALTSWHWLRGERTWGGSSSNIVETGDYGGEGKRLKTGQIDSSESKSGGGGLMGGAKGGEREDAWGVFF